MPSNHNISAALASLYPAAAQAFFSARLPATAALLTEELGATSGMVEKRLAEFTHGRYCARSAMQLLNMDAAPIPKGPNREPVWPAGIIGSITHTEGAAAAVVAKSTDVVALGLDMELNAPLTPDLITMICLPEENPDQDGTRAKLLFSAKESIYKCLYPLLKEYVDFLEMEVVLDEAAKTFAARPRATRLDPRLITRLQGRYIYQAEFVISAAWIL